MSLKQSSVSGSRLGFGLFPPGDPDSRTAGVELSAILSELPTVERAWPDLRADRLTIFICCDSIYFEQHGLPFARSLDRNSPGAHLHIHLINPDTRSKRHLAELDLSNTALSHSAEFIDFDGLSAEFMRTYCACIRFVRQYELLAASEKPIIAFDADVLIRESLEPLRIALVRGGYDCAVHTRLKSRKRRERFLLSAFYVCPSRVGLKFLEGLAIRVALPLLQRDAGWYLDQEALYETYCAHQMVGPPVRLYHLPKRLSDWDFDKRSAIWVAKGWRKFSSDKFIAHQDVYRTVDERISRLHRTVTSNPRVGIVLPDPDLPFRRPTGFKGLHSLIKGQERETKRLRVYWRKFAHALREEYGKRGHDVSIVTRPLWKVTEEFVNGLGLDMVFLPHKHRFEIPVVECRTYSYMQVVFPWLFSVDPLGWGGASSRYPCDCSGGNPESGVFEACVDRVVGQNGSKFEQPARVPRQRLVERGEIPDASYIFFPCQRPNDQSIELFCDHEAVDVVRELADWARMRDIHLVLKAHPMNVRSAEPFRRAAQGKGIVWSTASVHDLIAHSDAVYLINSGVGFEALLHNKPVVTFGRVEYDAVSIHGDPRALDQTWDAVRRSDSEQRLADYRRFVDWFCRLYCVDLGDARAAKVRLAALVDDTLEAAPYAASA